MWKRSNFSFFPHYFIYLFLTSRVKLHIDLLNVDVQFIVFLTLSTLICRGTDISKCFSESLGFRDNESRLYIEKETYSRASTVMMKRLLHLVDFVSVLQEKQLLTIPVCFPSHLALSKGT